MHKIVTLVFLSLTYFISHQDLWFHPFSCKWHDYSFLHGHVRFLCIHTPHFLYWFICWWSSRPVLFSGYSKYCSNKHRCVSVSVVCWLRTLWAYAQAWHSWVLFLRTSILSSTVAGASLYLWQQRIRLLLFHVPASACCRWFSQW